MTRILALLVALALAGASEPAIQARDAQRAIAERLLAAYVFVGGGSGVLVSADGEILTNDHVAGGGASWVVSLRDGRTYPARLLGTDPVGDICLLQIDDVDGLPHVELAGPGAFVPGAPAYAVGNPFSLGDQDGEPTFTTGVLSTVRVVRGNYTDCLQMDTPVNPGNSGGPLLDSDGRLLGINGQIRTRTGMRINSGIGLAICATQLAAFLPHLRAADGGYVHHTAAPDGLELEPHDGQVVVTAASDDSPLQPGDHLLTVDGRPATSVATALGLFAARPFAPGVTATAAVLRDGIGLEVSVPLARTRIPGRPWHGLVVRSGPEGVRVTGRETGSPADLAQIPVPSRLVAAEGRAVTRRLDLLKVLASKEVGDRLRLRLEAAGEERDFDLLLRPKP